MIDKLYKKIRALIEDFPTSDIQLFRYTVSNVFTLAEPNIITVDLILINGIPLSGGQSFLYSQTTKKITVSGVSFNVDDVIEVDYTFSQTSDEELIERIRAALCWLSIFEYSDTKFELQDKIIYEAPSNNELNLIALIASILIKPDCQSMSLPNMKVVYSTQLNKEEKIENLIMRFKYGIGVSKVLSI